MKFACKFVDGPYDGKMANVEVPEFKIGTTLDFGGIYYTIQDGAAAKLFEQKQEGSDFLMCLVKYAGEKEKPPCTYCDSLEHIRSECLELTAVINQDIAAMTKDMKRIR